VAPEGSHGRVSQRQAGAERRRRIGSEPGGGASPACWCACEERKRGMRSGSARAGLTRPRQADQDGMGRDGQAKPVGLRPIGQ
jgi:hypothetical protein